MCADKPNEDMSYCEFDDHNESVFIASDVKDIVLVSNIISCREVGFDVREVIPLGMRGDMIPSLKCRLRVSVTF